MRKNSQKNSKTTKLQKGVVKKRTTKRQTKELPVGSSSTSQIMEKAIVLAPLLEKPSIVDLIRSIQTAEGNFDCFGTANGYCDQWECRWRTFCLLSRKNEE